MHTTGFSAREATATFGRGLFGAIMILSAAALLILGLVVAIGLQMPGWSIPSFVASGGAIALRRAALRKPEPGRARTPSILIAVVLIAIGVGATMWMLYVLNSVMSNMH